MDIKDYQQFKDFNACKYPPDFSCPESCKVDFPWPDVGLDLTPIGNENSACNQDKEEGYGELFFKIGFGDGLEMGGPPPKDPVEREKWELKFSALVLGKVMKLLNGDVKEITKNSKCNSGCSPSVSINPNLNEMEIVYEYFPFTTVLSGSKVTLPYIYTISCSGMKDVNSWKVDVSVHAEKICMEKDKEGS